MATEEIGDLSNWSLDEAGVPAPRDPTGQYTAEEVEREFCGFEKMAAEMLAKLGNDTSEVDDLRLAIASHLIPALASAKQLGDPNVIHAIQNTLSRIGH